MGELSTTSVDLQRAKNDMVSANWPMLNYENRIWYRDVENQLDFSFIANHSIIINNLETNSSVYSNCEEVFPGVWRKVKEYEIIPYISIEGYCLEARTERTYQNYEFVLNNASKPTPQTPVNILQTNQIGGTLNLMVDGKNIENAEVVVSTLLGQIVYKKKNFSGNSIVFRPSTNGIYIISVSFNSSIYSEKKFLNQ